MRGFDPNKCLRKNSCDNSTKDLNHSGIYPFCADNFSHIIPKWLKTFYISPYYFSNISQDDSRIIFNNYNLFKNYNKCKEFLFKLSANVNNDYVDLEDVFYSTNVGNTSNNSINMKINSELNLY